MNENITIHEAIKQKLAEKTNSDNDVKLNAIAKSIVMESHREAKKEGVNLDFAEFKKIAMKKIEDRVKRINKLAKE